VISPPSARSFFISTLLQPLFSLFDVTPLRAIFSPCDDMGRKLNVFFSSVGIPHSPVDVLDKRNCPFFPLPPFYDVMTGSSVASGFFDMIREN